MKKLSCMDMGMDCHFEATGGTAEEVKQKLVDHAMTAHKDKMDAMSQAEKDGMMKMMDEKMHDA